MLFVSEIQRTAPARFRTPLQRQVYETLERLRVPYERVDSDEIITMADCREVEERLGMHMVKTLFLCDRKQTQYYVFVTRGNKSFRSKAFRDALGVSPVSFAPSEQMEALLGTSIGAATIFSCLLDSAKDVLFVFDQEVTQELYYGCSDGTTTGYLKLLTQDLLQRILPSRHCDYRIIQMGR